MILPVASIVMIASSADSRIAAVSDSEIRTAASARRREAVSSWSRRLMSASPGNRMGKERKLNMRLVASPPLVERPGTKLSRLRLAIDQGTQLIPQIVPVDWLSQEPRCAKVVHSAGEGRVFPAGEHDDRNSCGGRAFLQPTQEVFTVSVRHLLIEDDRLSLVREGDTITFHAGEGMEHIDAMLL